MAVPTVCNRALHIHDGIVLLVQNLFQGGYDAPAMPRAPAHHSEFATGHGLHATHHTEEATKHHAEEHTGKGTAA